MAEGVLAAGTARAAITPDPAMVNWVTRAPYDGVIDPLHARVLALSDGADRFVLVCWDLIDAREEAVAAVRRAVSDATGVAADHVMVAASHTHSGPRSPFAAASVAAGERARQRVVLEDAVFGAWAKGIPDLCASLARQAFAAARPAELAIGRANAAEWLFNRRPLDPRGNVVTMFTPEDPTALPDGLRFGAMDPTLTVLSLRGPDSSTVATVFSVPCHSVSVYPHHKGVSADWPGVACARIAAALGGEALFLQGCAGDIVPARRGLAERDAMGRFFADRAIAASGRAWVVAPSPVKAAARTVYLPLTEAAREEAGADTVPAEVQALRCGDAVVVALPGEPLNGLAREIQARSPWPHTLVVGYANGRGAGYVGLPGEKARGGYEAGAGRASEEAGLFLIETAVRLLGMMAGEQAGTREGRKDEKTKRRIDGTSSPRAR